jgi:hypothetical protein
MESRRRRDFECFHCLTLFVTKAIVNIQQSDRKLVDCNNLKPAPKS